MGLGQLLAAGGVQFGGLAADLNFRMYIPERKRPHRSLRTDKPVEFQLPVDAIRRRLLRDNRPGNYSPDGDESSLRYGSQFPAVAS